MNLAWGTARAKYSENFWKRYILRHSLFLSTTSGGLWHSNILILG